jgi:hypothetical protein
MKTNLMVICFGLFTCATVPASEIEPVLSSELIGHWTFDELEQGTFRGSGEVGLEGNAIRSISVAEGIFGAGAYLEGKPVLRINAHEAFGNLAEIAISAWVNPRDLSGYREIFRKEDGDRRILFSFQNSGQVLSLGLNIEGSGYGELDARINPAQLIDQQWHHVAGTFDGKTMRVYLDGREAGSLERPGRILSGGKAPAFIGSSGGTGEYFQGGIDDLRIARVAWTNAQVAQQYQAGLHVVLGRLSMAKEQLADIYQERATFAETMGSTRKKLIEQRGNIPSVLLGLIQAKLAARFPAEHDAFVKASKGGANAYLAAQGNSWNVEQGLRLMSLATEYRPVTAQQWANCGNADQQKWQAIDQLAAKFSQLQHMGDEASDSADWINLLLALGRQISYRPVQYEAVAPYVKPYTPETRDWSPQEAQEILRRDWLHQADGAITPELIRQEMGWAREMAARIGQGQSASTDLSRALAELKALEGKTAKATLAEQYYALRRVKRRIMFAHPAIDFDAVLFIDIPRPGGSEAEHETRHRLGYMAVPGGRLLTLKGLSPAGRVTKLMPQEPLHGTFWRPDLSFDAQRVLVSFHPANEKSFNLYEVNIDGSGMRQITQGIYDDVDPIYLPDEKHIVFASTCGHNYVRCMPPTNSFSLTRCDLQGNNMYIISRNNEPDYLPALLADGRVIYTRWEYTDKPLWRAQSLWTMNPDGTVAATFWGNQSVWPDLLKDARQIPGSDRVMFTGSAHHNWFAGCIGIVNPHQGLNFPEGLTKVTAELEWPESGNGPVDPVESPQYHPSGVYSAYQTPYPLSEDLFMVSAQRQGKFVLYLMDTAGNRELIYQGVHNVLHALPLKPRPRPAVIPDRVKWPNPEQRLNPEPGIIFSNNVYHRSPPQLQGKAKYLRVLTMDAKTYTYWYKRPYASTGPVVSMVSSEGVKRILGTVPIAKDGSVHFEAPSGKALYFQLLDEKYRALQTMRSISGVMPGETRGCLGCHEMHNTTPMMQGKALALQAAPATITPPPWGDESISYIRFVQPVLDKYCGECHQGKGKARETLDLTLRGQGIFKEPYVHLIGNPSWGAPYHPPAPPPPGFGIADTLLVEAYDQRDPKAYITPEPMTKLSYKSRLIDMAASGRHHDVKVDERSRRQLIAWVDTMCPYRGDEEVREIEDPEFQGVDWLAIRPEIKNAPVVVRPGPIEGSP